MPSIDLSSVPIPHPVTLDQIRTSKMRPFGTIQSGIDKQRQAGRLYVSTLGLPADEHDLTFHGGIDKAIHHYDTGNYSFWIKMYDSAKLTPKFVPGGFGENIVASGLNEVDICIGDLVRIGPPNSILTGGDNGCLLEVSLPRQPCFKLNQRFGLKKIATQAHQHAKTGWYYRVKEEGFIEEGNEIRVVRRDYPRWSISRLHHYIHRDKTDLDITQELRAIKVMGSECRGVFEQRWDQNLRKEEEKRAPKPEWVPYKVMLKTPETPLILRLELEAIKKIETPSKIPPTSHVALKLPTNILRHYSIVSGDANQIVLGIALDPASRGGSKYIHHTLIPNSIVHLGPIRQTLKLSADGLAPHYDFIVGGVGITSILSLTTIFAQINHSFHLHYAVRSAEEVAFRSMLTGAFEERVTIYDKARGERMHIKNIVANKLSYSRIYTCGPARMLNAVAQAAEELGLASDEVQYENFTAEIGGDPFSVSVVGKSRVASTASADSVASQMLLEVPSDRSLLQVLKDVDFQVDSSCEVGNCGTCRVAVKCGRVDHRGSGLTKEEQKTEMLSCVSRGIGRIEIELPGDDE